MDGKVDRKAFAAIHDLKNDAVRLSRHIDRIEDIAIGNEVLDRDVVITSFLEEYETFLTKYDNSVNERIRAFMVEIKEIVISRRAELAAIGLDVDRNGGISLFDIDCLIKDTGVDDGEQNSVFAVLNEALLNAEVHMERFIPEKYLSYDKQRDYRILKQEGNIYTREV